MAKFTFWKQASLSKMNQIGFNQGWLLKSYKVVIEVFKQKYLLSNYLAVKYIFNYVSLYI